MDDKQKELLARATGADKGAAPKQPRVPPPARPIPGITGNPPLPPKPVAVKRTLTDVERAALVKVGWDDSMPLPNDIRPALEAASQAFVEEQDEIVLPVDPRTPRPEIPKDVPYESLDAEAKKKVRDVFATAARLEEEARAVDDTDLRMQQIPGGAAALAATRGMVPELEIEDDSDKTTKETVPQAGAALHTVQFCPNCAHDMNLPAGPEPPYEKKMAFLHSILGQKPFFDDQTPFDGNVVITFRTLTTQEIEVIFKQAHIDREKGRAASDVDYWERVNRYRLFLQLVKFKTETHPHGFVEDFPDGLSPETNDMAKKCWTSVLQEQAAEGETILPLIEQALIGNGKPLKTEHKFRICNNASNRFNRMVARLEAMVDNSDFWKPTEGHA